jgi:ribosomal protein S18 acetylase RimI-like enzyme
MNIAQENAQIRSYLRVDARELAELYNQLHPARPLTDSAFHRQLEDTVGHGNHAWVVVMQERPVAFAAISTVPGLPNIAHLEGFVALEWQRQGLGRCLLGYVCREARQQGLAQLSCPVEELESPVSRFLLGRGFELEHEEIILKRPTLDQLPMIRNATSGEIVTLPRQEAISHFCNLYELVFFGLPWYQPYSPVEVVSLLRSADDMLFLRINGKLCGFVWQQLEANTGVIEPIGVIATNQGNGYGRQLLLAALHRLRERGAQRAQIGAWKTNQGALRLYESFGFQHDRSLHYLALNL